jgi:uncharacterized iron-regulated membrane protein
LAISNIDSVHFGSDLNQVHKETGYSRQEHPFDVEEKKHFNKPDHRMHQTLSPARAIKRKRSFFHLNRSIHKWIGIAVSIILLALAVTGILLNHKKEMGYMPDIEHEASGQISQGLPIEEVAMIAIKASGNKDIDSVTDIDRIDYRTKNMSAKVRFKDSENTEVIVDSVTGKVLNVGSRTDVFLEKLHSGEIFGDMFILVTDAAAASLVLLTFSGFYIWIWPKWRRRSNMQLKKERSINFQPQSA